MLSWVCVDRMKKEDPNNFKSDRRSFDSADDEQQFDLWQAELNKELLSFWKLMLDKN
jgi:hypothetical protein